MSEVLALDLGGTKLLLARVDAAGTILQRKKVSVDLTSGPSGLLEQISSAAKSIQTPKVKALALSSAGPLDPVRGTWLNPTNLKTEGAAWGEVPVVDRLTKTLNMPCYLENDAACAAIAESWLGHGRDVHNFISITLGTGVGVGVWINGALLRSGRFLHTELGHLILNSQADAAVCGCGNKGCAEAYLSGANFSRLVSNGLEAELSGEEILQKAKAGDLEVLQYFDDYAALMALFVRNLVVAFYPQKVIFSGGFSASAPFFIEKAKRRLHGLMAERLEIEFIPSLLVSAIRGDMGVLGAARVAFTRLGEHS